MQISSIFIRLPVSSVLSMAVYDDNDDAGVLYIFRRSYGVVYLCRPMVRQKSNNLDTFFFFSSALLLNHFLRNHKQTPKNIKKNKVLYSIAQPRRLSPDGFPSLLTLRWRRVPMKSELGTIDATYSIHRPPSSRQSNIFIPCELFMVYMPCFSSAHASYYSREKRTTHLYNIWY